MELLSQLDAAARVRVMAYLNNRFSGNEKTNELAPATLVKQTTVSAKSAKDPGSPAKGPKAEMPEAQAKEAKRPKATEGAKKPKAGRKTFSILPGLNFKPEGKESLKSYFDRLKPTKFPERNAIIVYYMDRVMGLTGITPDHINTAYKAIKINPPADLYQSLLSTASDTKYYSTSDTSDMRILDNGVNYVENGVITTKK